MFSFIKSQFCNKSDKHQKHQIDINVAINVVNIINDIGEVSVDSENRILSALQSYNALTDMQKAYVSNIDILSKAGILFLAMALRTGNRLCQI